MTAFDLLRRLAATLLAIPVLLALAAPCTAEAEALLHVDHPLAGRIWDPAAGAWTDAAAVRRRAAAADVLLLGETHDNPVHHQHQQELLQARIDAGARPILLMEQFDRERQAGLDEALAGADHDAAIAAATALGKGWDWPQYRPLLAAAHLHKLQVIAANLSRERIRPIIRQGFAGFDAAELERLAIEAVWSDGRQRYVSGLMEKSHCGQINADLQEGLVKGQRTRDAVMADAVLFGLQRAAGTAPASVVGIVGRGHARHDVGIPLYLAGRSPATRVLSVAFVEVSPELTTPEAYEAERPTGTLPFDLVWFTPRATRSDPCENFGRK